MRASPVMAEDPMRASPDLLILTTLGTTFIMTHQCCCLISTLQCNTESHSA